MTFLTSKWLIVTIIVIVFSLVLLYLIGRKSVHTEIVTPASVEQIWSVLVDTKQYEQWNQVFELLEGNLQEGETVKYRFHQDDDNAYEISTSVKQVLENKLLNQGGGMPGVLSFDHRYILEPIEGGTKVVIHEDYRGIAVPFWNPEPVGKAYHRLGQALKNRVAEVYPHE